MYYTYYFESGTIIQVPRNDVRWGKAKRKRMVKFWSENGEGRYWFRTCDAYYRAAGFWA